MARIKYQEAAGLDLSSFGTEKDIAAAVQERLKG
jgi:hypothetical protein